MTEASTIAEQTSVRQLTQDAFVSNFNPISMGNTAKIAYGGCAMGVGINAAYQTVKPGYHVYSMMGHCLGPAKIDRKILCKVSRLRDTRTFATRFVEMSQKLDDGSIRVCVAFLADFQVQERAALLEYSVQPETASQGPEESQTASGTADQLLREGKVTPETVASFNEFFNDKFFETRSPPEGMFAQTLAGMLGNIPTSQDDLPLPSRTSSQWSRSRHVLQTEGDRMSALAFYMDGALSLLPLTHSKMSLLEAGACSTLDFGLRIFSGSIDMTEWHLKEMKTIHGSNGRTYSESRLFNEAGENMAVMTQQSILRPKPPPRGSL